ncbi:MAG: precorrin-4 C(11)-methyltransferase [Pseudomonadota bacterium]
MTVYFIGAGPGAADLLTIRGRDLIRRCELCLYAGSLVPEVIAAHAPRAARVVNTAGLALEEIMAELTVAHAIGQDVARVHSGDPSLYSAIGEQMAQLDAENIPYEVVPGVPAFAAAAAAIGKELTLPEVAQSVVLTRTSARSSPMPDGEDLATFAASGATLILHLSARRMTEVAAELLPFYGADCPAVCVAHASQPNEVILHATLGNIGEKMKAAEIVRTAIILIGPVLAAEAKAKSRLYDATHDRYLKPASAMPDGGET